jgi:hypothetical protein
MGFERFQRRQQDGDAALHVGDAGTVQGAVGRVTTVWKPLSAGKTVS